MCLRVIQSNNSYHVHVITETFLYKIISDWSQYHVSKDSGRHESTLVDLVPSYSSLSYDFKQPQITADFFSF